MSEIGSLEKNTVLALLASDSESVKKQITEFITGKAEYEAVRTSAIAAQKSLSAAQDKLETDKQIVAAGLSENARLAADLKRKTDEAEAAKEQARISRDAHNASKAKHDAREAELAEKHAAADQERLALAAAKDDAETLQLKLTNAVATCKAALGEVGL